MTITNEKLLDWVQQVNYIPQMDLIQMLSEKKVEKFKKQNAKIIQKMLDDWFDLSAKYHKKSSETTLEVTENGSLVPLEGADLVAYQTESAEFMAQKVTMNL